jgi:hypothetical protein
MYLGGQKTQMYMRASAQERLKMMPMSYRGGGGDIAGCPHAN